MRYFRRIKYGISNLVLWLPIIWSDRHWHENYIFIILHKKLIHMEKFFRSKNVYAENSEEVAYQIKLVKEALSRIIEDKYLEEETVNYDKKYGDKELFTFEKTDNKNYSKLVWTENEDMKREFSEASSRAEKRRKDDQDFVFSFMSKHINGWWD